jgi:indolepyruvate ferredoxin oxidoreductase
MDLEEAFHAKLAQFVYDLVMFEGIRYAQRYLQRLWTTYQKDQKARGYAATRAVLENLSRVMIIKDEIYVAHLLTSEEKFRRDKERYRIDEERGDQVRYIHLNRPQFTLFGRDIEFDLNGRNWQLRLMKRMRFLRRLLPEWHAREKAFRTWYETLVDGFNIFSDEETYRLYVEALKLPEDVRGYRKVRYPKMEAARQKAESLLAQIHRRRSGNDRTAPPPEPGKIRSQNS